jgi:hypothetical protein
MGDYPAGLERDRVGRTVALQERPFHACYARHLLFVDRWAPCGQGQASWRHPHTLGQ